ncbi:HNH endonuclease signature motif containing protein [Hoeflea sp. TYP-13]|uniref:HNH endonuclease signature motif containing protein n=1 Tax=Hoeflea sp. TYP-13 TaxID=3230023 RepID=UPI0034C5E809
MEAPTKRGREQMKGRWIQYTDDELEFIEQTSTLPRRQAYAAFREKFDRTDVSLNNYKALCKRKGWLTGRTGQFVKGGVPANKGKKMPYNANRARTQFKKGGMPHNTKFAGHERITRDGYVEISVEETNPHTGFGRRYVQKHRWLWEKENGPVPAGHCLKSVDGDKTNTDPSNWICIPRALLPRLAGRWTQGYDEAPAELKPVILATAKLEHRAREEGRRGHKETG